MNIKWTKRAVNNLNSISNYLEKEWSTNSSDRFQDRIRKFLIILKNQPEIGKVEIPEKKIRAFVISRHNTVFNRIKNETIIILFIFNNRQNPIKKRKI